MAVAYRYGEIQDRDNNAVIDCPICNGKGCKQVFKKIPISDTAEKMYRLADEVKPVHQPEQQPEGFNCIEGKLVFNESCMKYLTEDVWQFIQSCQLADSGHLPEAGGINDQANTFKVAYLYFRNDEKMMELMLKNRYGN